MKLANIGQFLFRFRAVIAVPFYFLLLICSRPSPYIVIIVSLALWLAGMSIRIWAMGYVGNEARSNKFSTPYYIINGPYSFFRHPLYLGNFLLVLGTVLLYNPLIYVSLLLVFLFLLEYTIIMHAENRYLRRLKKKAVRFRFSRIKVEISTIIVLGFVLAIYLFKNIEVLQPR